MCVCACVCLCVPVCACVRLCASVGAATRVGVFVLVEHEPVSQEEKMRTRIDGRNKEEEKQRKMEKGCMSRI